jgi:arginyl-tRNA--protein-N-Asp/Glu arginylyltransferase
MFTEKHYLERIPSHLLDAYLERGWYRMGQAIFTCRFLLFEGKLFSSVWIRLPLQAYQFRKSLRKLHRKVHRDFRVVTSAGTITAEQEELYQLYRRQFPGRLAPTLRMSLLDDTENNIFETRKIEVYDGDQLIAFSFFDLGKKSLASILGVYHPDYQKYSLGFFTLLEEIQYGLDQGFQYFYPGYIVPGYSRFDYKSRIGEVECYDERSDTWIHETNFNFQQLPPVILNDKLQAAQQALAELNFDSKILLYPPYEANLIGYWVLDYLEYPLILQCGSDLAGVVQLIATYDHLKEKYRLFYCSNYDDLSEFFLGAQMLRKSTYPVQLGLLIKEETILETDSVTELAKAVIDQRQGKPPFLE